MNTQGENLACPEGVVDVSIVVPSCFENPLKNHSITFLADALKQKKRVLIPVPVILGAYHITTRYLRVPRITAKKILEGILGSGSQALHSHIPAHMAADALDYASTYNIESWDGYLISLARSLGTAVIYSLDKELSKVKEVIVVNPFPDDVVQQYHNYINSRIK
ncbi:MAG: type II toxin-antitoxin system VapC family toxin [Candidatus Bathycorpusculaceae bacterium]